MILGVAKGFGNAKKTWQRYVSSCEYLGVEYRVVDILSDKWLYNIQEVVDVIQGLLVGPPCQSVEEYDIYMERIYFINQVISIPIYPSYRELKLYENKRYCTSWMQHMGIPHPETHVFVNKKEAIDFVDKAIFPLVSKSSIGAGSTAVHILKSKSRALSIINHAFGFNRFLSLGYVSWVTFKHPWIKIPMLGSSQKHYVLFQKYIPIKWEWRIIKIGHSFFGHQKLLKGEFASGSDSVGWVDPPKHLFDLIADICEKGDFFSMAIDVFETKNGDFIVNELQSMFGSYDDSQMYINGIPGRYTYRDGKYIFEEGYFNKFGSCLLRVEHFTAILTEQKEVDHP